MLLIISMPGGMLICFIRDSGMQVKSKKLEKHWPVTLHFCQLCYKIL